MKEFKAAIETHMRMLSRISGCKNLKDTQSKVVDADNLGEGDDLGSEAQKEAIDEMELEDGF